MAQRRLHANGHAALLTTHDSPCKRPPPPCERAPCMQPALPPPCAATTIYPITLRGTITSDSTVWKPASLAFLMSPGMRGVGGGVRGAARRAQIDGAQWVQQPGSKSAADSVQQRGSPTQQRPPLTSRSHRTCADAKLLQLGDVGELLLGRLLGHPVWGLMWVGV